MVKEHEGVREVEIVKKNQLLEHGAEQFSLPVIRQAGPQAEKAVWEYFTAHIRNKNTRLAYARQVGAYCQWCEEVGLELIDLEPAHIAHYIETFPGSVPSSKQALAAIRMLFDWLVVRQVIPSNPAAPVKGAKHIVHSGKTPVLNRDELKQLFDSIDTTTLTGLRDKGLLASMFYSFARISALLSMNVADYFPKGKRYWFRLREKGGRHHEIPVHHLAEEAIDQYLGATGLAESPRSPLWQGVDKSRKQLSGKALTRNSVWRMVQRRTARAGILTHANCHSFRASGITIYLKNEGQLEHAQQIAGHSSPRTTKLYDRRHEEISLDEIERIRL